RHMTGLRPSVLPVGALNRSAPRRLHASTGGAMPGGSRDRVRGSRTRRDRIVILGSGEFAQRLVDAMGRARRARYAIAGIVSDTSPAPDAIGGIPVLDAAADLTRIIDETGATRVIVAVGDRRTRLPIRQLLDCGLRGIDVEEGVEI